MHCCSDCLRSPPPWQLGLAAVSYEWPWVHLIAQYKYLAQPGWSGTLASLMHSAPGVEDALAQAQCVIPVPLSLERLAQRGFNQSLLLAQNLSPQHTRFDVLLRLRDTTSQRGLARRERLHNLRDAFAVNPLQAASLRNQHVVLVDDVMTTGASLQMAAKALLSAGAAHLTTVVFARTENKELDQA